MHIAADALDAVIQLHSLVETAQFTILRLCRSLYRVTIRAAGLSGQLRV
jgi:hypothetical protein